MGYEVYMTKAEYALQAKLFAEGGDLKITRNVFHAVYFTTSYIFFLDCFLEVISPSDRRSLSTYPGHL